MQFPLAFFLLFLSWCRAQSDEFFSDAGDSNSNSNRGSWGSKPTIRYEFKNFEEKGGGGDRVIAASGTVNFTQVIAVVIAVL